MRTINTPFAHSHFNSNILSVFIGIFIGVIPLTTDKIVPVLIRATEREKKL